MMSALELALAAAFLGTSPIALPQDNAPPSAVAPLPAPRPATDSPDARGFLSAGDLHTNCTGSSIHGHSYCYAYFAAVADTIAAYQVWLGLRDVCLPRGTTQGELKDIFMAYLVNNPSRAGDQAASIVVTAMQGRFPCEPAAETLTQ